jgi:uncharacterized membrane protein
METQTGHFSDVGSLVGAVARCMLQICTLSFWKEIFVALSKLI